MEDKIIDKTVDISMDKTKDFTVDKTVDKTVDSDKDNTANNCIIGNKKKKWKFKIFVGLYITLWAVIIVCACKYVWVKLDEYQIAYEYDKAASNPTILIEEYIANMNDSNIADYIDKDTTLKVSEFESKADICNIIKKTIASYDITYEKKKDEYASNSPVYELKCHNNAFAKIKLTTEDRKSGYGFNIWKIDSISFSDYVNSDKYVIISALDTVKVTVNGIQVSNQYIQTGSVQTEFADEIKQYTGRTTSYVKYKVDKLYSIPEVKAFSADGSELTGETADHIEYSYDNNCTEDFIAKIRPSVILASEAYAKYITRYIEDYEEIKDYFLVDSSIYKAIKQAESGIGWNNVPLNMTFSNFKMSNVVKYSDTCFSCNIFYTQKSEYRGGEKYTKTDSAKFSTIFKFNGTMWQMVYQKIM